MIKLLAAAAAAATLLTSAASAQAPAAPAAEWRTPDPENVLVIETTKGAVFVELAPLAAPNHVARVKELTRRGFYNGLLFHRVIGDFMAQTGDPEGTGMGQSDLPDLEAEFSFQRGREAPATPVRIHQSVQEGFVGSLAVKGQPDMGMMVQADGKVDTVAMYCPGVAAMARGGAENSANSQFFLTREAYPSLEGKYTVWGRVVSGLEVVRALAVGEPPRNPDRMVTVRVLADLPAAERPVVRVMDTRSAAFRALIAAARTKAGAEFTACDVEIPAQVTVATAR